MSTETVFPKVQEIVADVLAIEEEEVELNKALINDLGAESIDFLDLIFRLEKEFKIKIPRGQIEKEARGQLSDEEFEENGVITAKGMEVVKNYLSEVPADKFPKKLKVAEIPTLFTVKTFCKLVANAQAKTEAAAE